MDNIWIAVIAALATIAVGIGSPYLLSILSGRQAVERQQKEWERQDKRIAEGRLLAEHLAEESKIINGKIDGISVMCDGALTLAMKSDVDSTKRTVALLQELESLKPGGLGPMARAEIEEAQAKIAGMAVTIADREHQVKIAEAITGVPPKSPEPDQV